MLALPAFAQEAPQLSFGDQIGDTADDAPTGTLSTQGTARRVIFSVLLGAENRPAYFGSDETVVRPVLRPSLLSLNYGPLNLGDEADAFDDDPNDRPLGFGVGGSLRYVDERTDEDYDELDGLDDVDGSLELGLIAGYVWPNAEVFGIARYGVTGHNGWVGELGANYVANPADGFVLRVGPRATFGSDNYNDTYFGITPSEAAASDFEAYDPDSGLVSSGLEVIASYQLGERWWLEGRARWEQYQDQAADSPIVEQGSEEATTVSIGVRRAFVLDF